MNCCKREENTLILTLTTYKQNNTNIIDEVMLLGNMRK